MNANDCSQNGNKREKYLTDTEYFASNTTSRSLGTQNLITKRDRVSLKNLLKTN